MFLHLAAELLEQLGGLIKLASVRLVKGNGKASIPMPTQSTIAQQESSITTNSEESVIEELEEDTDANFINSPMVGTFYASVSPPHPPLLCNKQK